MAIDREPQSAGASGRGRRERKSSAVPFVLTAAIVVIAMVLGMLWVDTSTGLAEGNLPAPPAATAAKGVAAPPATLPATGNRTNAKKDESTSVPVVGTVVVDVRREIPSTSVEAAPAVLSAPDNVWRSIERIDAKAANTLTLLTLFLGVIVALLGLYEFFKLREIDRLQEKIESDIEVLFDRQFSKLSKGYERMLTRKLIDQIDAKTVEIAESHLRMAAVGHRVLLSYVQNDLGGDLEGPITVKQMRMYIECERALGQLHTSNDEENLTGLTLIQSLLRSVGRITATSLLQYLAIVRDMGVLSSWQNQELCNAIIYKLEGKAGISASEVIAGN